MTKTVLYKIVRVSMSNTRMMILPQRYGKGSGPDNRGNCFDYDSDHPPYDESDYVCVRCGRTLTGNDDFSVGSVVEDRPWKTTANKQGVKRLPWNVSVLKTS